MNFLKKIYTKYFSLNLNDYQNIDVDFEINKFLFLVTLGLCIACFFINYYQSNISLLLKKLIRLEAFSEDKSKTLKELGLDGNKSVKMLISKNFGVLKKVIGVVGIKKMTYEEYVSAEKQKKQKKKRLISKIDNESENENTDSSENQVKRTDFGIDFSKAKIYILPDMKDYATHTLKSNPSPIKTVLSCITIVAFFVFLILIMPNVLNLVNTMMA